MAKQIKIYLAGNNIPQIFREKGRAGGSYTIRVEYRGNWVVVIDEWEAQTAFPSERVLKVEVEEHQRW